MAVVPIIIDGQKYNLSCDDGQEERLAAIGRAIDKKATLMRRNFPQISDNLMLVMVSVLFAEETLEAKLESNPDYESSAEIEEKYTQELEKIRKKIEELTALV